MIDKVNSNDQQLEQVKRQQCTTTAKETKIRIIEMGSPKKPLIILTRINLILNRSEERRVGKECA